MCAMDVNDIRKENLRQLIKEASTITALAEKADTAQAYISQILTESKNASGKNREIGTKLARKLENAMMKPPGWMDHSHTEISADIAAHRHELPILTWQQAIEWPDIGQSVRFDNWSPKLTDLPYNCFCLRVVSESMRNVANAKPTYPAGAIIYINPHPKAGDLDCVVLQEPAATKAIFKQLFFDGNRIYIRSMNPELPDRVERLAEGSRIIGVVDKRYLMEN